MDFFMGPFVFRKTTALGPTLFRRLLFEMPEESCYNGR